MMLVKIKLFRCMAGFTLVEIMLVMLILSVLTGVVVTNLHAGYQDLALEHDTVLLTEHIQAAQLHARTNYCLCRIVIDTPRGEYYLAQGSAADQPFRPLDNLGDTQTLDRSIHFHDVQKLDQGATEHDWINFYPDGTGDAATIILISDSGDERVIEIQALSGQPSIKNH